MVQETDDIVGEGPAPNADEDLEIRIELFRVHSYL